MDRSRTPPLRNTNNSRAAVGTTPLSDILRQGRTRRRTQSAQTNRGRSRISSPVTAFHSGQVLEKDLALRSRHHLTYSITIIHRHIPQGVRGPHKLEPTSPQLHSDFTPGWCRSFGQVSLVSRADSHLHSARQSSIIFMLLNQSDCR